MRWLAAILVAGLTGWNFYEGHYIWATFWFCYLIYTLKPYLFTKKVQVEQDKA